MACVPESEQCWGGERRLFAAEKWKAKSAAMGQPVTDALVEFAQPKPGMRILDLGSGTGEPAISLAVRVAPLGHVTALDLSEDALAIAKRRAEERGLRNFSIEAADAHNLPFPDHSFDLATSRFGVMFFRDPVLAFRELRRVLRRGGRACFLVWGTFDQPYWQTMIGVVHRHLGGPLLQSANQDPCRFSEPGSLSAVLRNAGFDEVKEETRTLPWTWPGPPEEIWEQVQASAAAFRPLLDRVPTEMWPRIHADVHAAIRKYFDGNGVLFGATVVFASGIKPL